MSWTPDANAVEQLKHIFQGTLSPNNEERKLANEALVQAKQNLEIENYLFTILVFDNTAKPDVRAAAGINLKNIILKNKSNHSIDRSYITNNIIQGLTSPDAMVRNITGNVITSLFSIYGISQWGTALTSLLTLAHHGQGDGDHTTTSHQFSAQEAAMSALAKICEDSYYELDREYNGERPLNLLLPEFLKLMDSPSMKVKAFAVHCFNQFIILDTQSFLVLIDQFLTKIFELAQGTDSIETSDAYTLKKNICTAFLSILETRPDKLAPHIDGIMSYCLHVIQKGTNNELSLEAGEFLLALASSSDFKAVFTTDKLKVILPVLLDNMVYSEEEMFLMEVADNNDDANVADKDEDIKPTNAKSKDARRTNGTTKGDAANIENGVAISENGDGSYSNGADNDNGDDDDDDDDDDEEDDEDDMGEWSLRKCSAATLDVLSENLPQEVLILALPILQEKIMSTEWPTREAAILAFGAMSNSFINLASDKLPQLVPFLVDRLQDDQPRVRQITCWTLSRYAGWVSQEAHEGGEYATFFQPTFQSIVACALDPKKIVQEAACSALSAFIEESDPQLIEFYLEPLLHHFAQCFQTYQRKNLIILYDCVQTFVEKMGYENLSRDPKYVTILLPPLLQRWDQLSDDDTALWPLLECMASVAATLKELFAPYAIPVYDRALKILSNCILMDQNCQTDPSIDTPEKDFMVTSLDLIDGLIQGFEFHSIDLIQHHDKPSFDLTDCLLVCFEDFNSDVRQSAYALLGDMAIYIIDTLKPYLHPIFISIGNEINNRNSETFPVYNNAIWALGEMIIRLPAKNTEAYLSNLINLLVPVLNSTDTQDTVLENCAICLGRMGLVGAELLAPRLIEFVTPWCTRFVNLVDNEEKQTGLQGMLKVIEVNPDSGFGGLQTQQGKVNLAKFLEVLANYEDATSELQQQFLNLINHYKSVLGQDGWNQVLKLVNPSLRNSLDV
ncbi:kap104 [Candida margitis]|uniref:kap104 n=1 Tax=Candida margitis TaxID=1775924 RepID=UPI0022263B63|nr:kap104 [Candida margitis]KAI5969737.1 kap104 [Candida margitis]